MIDAFSNWPASIAATASTKFARGSQAPQRERPSLVLEKRVETIVAVLIHHDHFEILVLLGQQTFKKPFERRCPS